MRIEFDATLDDFLALHRDWHQRRRDQIKVPTPLWFWAWVVLVFATAGGYAAARVAGMSADNLMFGALHGVAAGCIGGAVLLLPVSIAGKMKRGSSSQYLRVVRQMVESGAITMDTGHHVVEIDGDMLSFLEPVRLIQQPLASFEAVEEHEDCVYLVRNGNPEFRIPRRAFESDAQLDEFKSLIAPHLRPGA